jgi:hypothetical protein
MYIYNFKCYKRAILIHSVNTNYVNYVMKNGSVQYSTVHTRRIYTADIDKTLPNVELLPS